MLTRDKYKLLDYGRKYFREDKPEDQEKVNNNINFFK